MEYAAELPAGVSENTSGEFRECYTWFALKFEGKSRGKKGRTSCPRNVQEAGSKKFETKHSKLPREATHLCDMFFILLHNWFMVITSMI